MRKTVLILLISMLALAAGASVYSVDEVPNVHLANRSDYVTNPDKILTEQAVSQLNDTIGNLWRATSCEMVVVAIDGIEGYDPDEFATKLFDKWKIGKSDRDNGLLMLIVLGERKVVIRTGRGLEGVLPDVVCGRIIRNVIIPAFKEGNYDGGTIAAVGYLSRIIENPANADEVMSAIPNDANVDSADEPLDAATVLMTMFWLGVAAAVFLLVVLVAEVRENKGRPIAQRYDSVAQLLPYALFASFLGLGVPLLALLPIVIVMKKIRGKHEPCSNCGCKMHKLSEERDNDYLSAGQDMEERLKSVDYDVWLCDNCGMTDVIPFENKRSAYKVCPDCGAKACALVSDRVMVPPTATREGRGIRIYSCKNCRHTHSEAYSIPKTVPPVIIVGGGGGRGGGFGGGGISGGSFGGGMTMGGGASGGW